MSRRVAPLAAVALLLLVTLARPARAQDGARRDEAPPPAPTGVVTKAPVLIQAVAPEYPPAALEAGKEAAVPVRIHIDENGIVTQVDVLEPQGDGFDEAAVAAAMQYVFDPAEIDGVPAAINVETTIHFVIQRQPEPEPEPEAPPPDGAPPEEAWPEPPPGHAGDPRKPVTLAGEVVERGTRRRLPGVIVAIAQLGLDAISDEEGRFWFHGVPAGDYDVLAVDQRYERLERRVTIAKDEALDVRLWMQPLGGNPYETIVEGEREQLEVTRRTLQRRQLTSVPGTFGDPIRVIQSLPGLAQAPFGLGILLVRGSNPDDTGIYIDGHRVPALFHFLGGPSILNAELVESIDLYPSGFPARFGRIHGGVVAIETRPSKSDGVHGSADVDLLDAGGYLRAPLGERASFAVAGRRSYFDAFLPLVLPEPEPGATQIVVPVYFDLQGRVDVELAPGESIAVTALASGDRLDVLTKDPNDEVDLGLDTSIDFFRLIGSYKRRLPGKLSLTLSPAFGRDSVTLASGASDSSSPYLSFGAVQTTLSYRMRITGPVTERLTIDTGVDLESRLTEYDALAPVDEDIRDNNGIDIPPEVIRQSAESLGIATYADLAIDLGGLRLVPGVRLDAYVLSGQTLGSIDPRISARYRLDDKWTVKGFLGRFSQPPQPEALDARFGNPDLGLEHAVHVGGGAEWRPSRLWLADVEIYYIDRNDLVGYTPRVVVRPDGTIDQPQFVNEGYGYTYGLEAMIRREITDDLYGWLSYTFSHSERALPDDEETNLSTFDQTHVANMVASWRPGGGWELGAKWRLYTGRPYTPVVDATYDADRGGYRPVRGEPRSARLPFFNQLDVRAEKTWLFNTWSLGLYLDVQNVLYTDNVEAIEYDYRYRETAPTTGVPILPTIGIRGAW